MIKSGWPIPSVELADLHEPFVLVWTSIHQKFLGRLPWLGHHVYRQYPKALACLDQRQSVFKWA